MCKTLLKNVCLAFILFVFNPELRAQVSESCDCSVDTLGYANFIQTLNPNENANFQFHVHGTFAVAYGVIGSTTPSVVQNLIDNHPDVTTIVMYACPGSDDDVSNLQASQLIKNAGYKMYLPFNGWIASGATDMFLAGSTRVVEVTIDAVGVHSWSDGTNEATDFPVGHAHHQPYIDYYVDMGFTVAEAESFYYFTINAAAANDIHWMSEAELDLYKIRTCRYASAPEYSVSSNGTTLTADLSGAMYQWINCDTEMTILGATSQSFTPIENGNYAVQITEQACMDTSSCYAITNIGIDEHALEAKLLAYPNPTYGDLSLDLGQMYSSVYTRLEDVTGRWIQSEEYTNCQVLKLNIEEPKGVYLLTLVLDEKTVTLRVLKR